MRLKPEDLGGVRGVPSSERVQSHALQFGVSDTMGRTYGGQWLCIPDSGVFPAIAYGVLLRVGSDGNVETQLPSFHSFRQEVKTPSDAWYLPLTQSGIPTTLPGPT